MEQPSHLTLTKENLDYLRDKVASGEYASESDVIEESLEQHRFFDEERARFEREVVVPALDEFLADPDGGYTIEEIELELGLVPVLQKAG